MSDFSQRFVIIRRNMGIECLKENYVKLLFNQKTIYLQHV